MFRFVVTLCAAIITIANTLTIPKGFNLLGEKYLVSDAKGTFFDSFLTCKQFGFNLASITSDRENLHLNSSLSLVPNTTYWLGGVLLRNDGGVFQPTWTWLDSGNDVNWAYWAEGEPSLQGGTNCIAMESYGHWRAYSCAAYNFKFICEGQV